MHYLFDFFRCHSQYESPLDLSISVQENWIPEFIWCGSRMHVLLLRSRLLAFLGFPLSPDLLDNTHFLESYCLSVRVPDGAEKKHNGSLANLRDVYPLRRRCVELTDVLASKEPSKAHRVPSCSGFVGGRRSL